MARLLQCVRRTDGREETWLAVNDGLAASTRAAAPATCGEAIDVPLIVLVAVFDEYQSEVMDEPGAKMSRQVP